MKTATIEKWTWILIYGGMICMALGLSMREFDRAKGWGLIACGGGVALLGVVCIWVRSRMVTPPESSTSLTKDPQP